MDKSDGPSTKKKLHPRNKHRALYNFEQLTLSCPELAPFVITNNYGNESIDFFNPIGVKTLNKALLIHYYGIKEWDIPPSYLCPAIPGRADYIHYAADLLSSSNKRKIPTGKHLKCLDIGVGANCVYPIIGNKEYGWSFIGADVDPKSIKSANKIIDATPVLKEKIELRLQTNLKDIFQGIIQKNEHFDLTICNPPFYASKEEAQRESRRKFKNLKGNKKSKFISNFGGQSNELYCDGGEQKFVCDMILQSKQFGTSCFWFTTLVSKEVNLKKAYQTLKKVAAVEHKTINMGQGNKTSRILAWTFLSPKQQSAWATSKWR